MTTEERVARLTRVVRDLVELLNGGPTGQEAVLSTDLQVRMALDGMIMELADLEQR
jgi:hypothetical protein